MDYDLIIVGGGPAGVAAGVYAARKKMRTVIVVGQFGGQSLVSAEIQNWIGTTALTGLELAERLEAHLRAQSGIDIVSGDTVAHLTAREGGGFVATTAGGKTFNAATVFLASGSRRKRLECPGERELEGRGVAYCSICDAPLFGGKDVAVVGGGNAGLEAVVDLIPYARRIYLLHRGEALKGDPVTQEKVRGNPAVQIILNAQVEAILGKEWVEKVRYRDGKTGASLELPVEGVFVEIGIVPSSDLVKGLAAVNERGEVLVDPRTQGTSAPGIWAAGDVTDGLYRQNNISAGDAVKAVLNIYDYLKKQR